MRSSTTKRTFTYKVVGDCEIRADVHTAAGRRSRPVILFLHGGALIGGDRTGSPFLIGMLVDAGYTVVSCDYRLAPETKIKRIIEDLRDAFRWVRAEGAVLFNANAERLGVMGNSAGGYLTLMSGCAVNPPPKALVSFYGYGDIDGPWLSKPDSFYCRQPLVDEATARSAVGARIISETSNANNRSKFYLYCRQRGLFPKEISGCDPERKPRALDPYCPIRSVTKSYPPTLLLHGDMDTDVPYQESVMMAERLGELGVEHELIMMEGRGHDFEQPGFADADVADALNRVLAFLKEHV